MIHGCKDISIKYFTKDILDLIYPHVLEKQLVSLNRKTQMPLRSPTSCDQRCFPDSLMQTYLPVKLFSWSSKTDSPFDNSIHGDIEMTYCNSIIL